MARTASATFAVVRDGVSVARITVTGAAEHHTFPVHVSANDSELEAKHFTNRTVAPDNPIAIALWRSITDDARESVANVEPELAAELDAGAGVPGPSPATTARKRADIDAARKSLAATPGDDELAPGRTTGRDVRDPTATRKPPQSEP